MDGQCHRCCIASIFEVPLESLPRMGGVPVEDSSTDPDRERRLGNEQQRETEHWLRQYGLGCYTVPYGMRPVYNDRGKPTHNSTKFAERTELICQSLGNELTTEGIKDALRAIADALEDET